MIKAVSSAHSHCEFKKRRKKKKKIEKNTKTLFGPTARGILWLVSLTNKHMAKQRQQSILAGEREFFSKKKKKKTVPGGWELGWFIKMRKWSSFWICFGSAGGMQRCCLNKAVDQCCCRCWRWQSVVKEALLWALSQWCRQSSRQATNLYTSLFAWIWARISGPGHGGPTEPFLLPLVWLTAPLLHACKTIFTLYHRSLACNLWYQWCMAADLHQNTSDGD